MTRRWLVVGGTGMLGADLARALDGRDATLVGSRELDIRDAEAVRGAVAGYDVVVNAAAHTRVDDAETEEERALAINGTGAGNLARAVAEGAGRILQVSTDYVFPGDASEPYAEDAPLAPLGAYGRTKAAGERAVRAALPDRSWIVRTAWIYGAGGPNFASTMLRLAAERDTVSVVTDQVGQPTWTADLAERIVAMVEADAPPGAYHGTNSGRASWFEFARAVFEEAGLDPARVLPTDSASFPRPAPRPAFSVLGHAGWARAGLAPMRPWRDALRAAFAAGAVRHP
ncbi:MAG: dTDP-4-dehydrorhamnose reductase [Actinomycetales bacterium]|nr:dTDP-4-dehydrorhamnose reductase [Actinomycetales bacterium]